MKVCPLCAEFAPGNPRYCPRCYIRLVNRSLYYGAAEERSEWQKLIRLLSLLLVSLFTLIGAGFFYLHW